MNNKIGYEVKKFEGKTRRYCQTIELRDDPQLIAEYCRLHSNAHHWREIRDGIKAVGILEMEIYILGNRLFMICEVPEDFDFNSAMAKLATLPRQQEWEDYVARFQKCEAGDTSSQKWQLMDRMFYLYE